MEAAKWQDTKLARLIERHADAANERHVLNACMPIIETILRSSAPASLDFTLHDDQHGYRVAEMAFALIDSCIETLSPTEVTMLLLSCYIHDIGMSPARDLVKRHYNWLLTADEMLLDAAEREQFQGWLDTNRSGLTAPVENSRVTTAGIKIADDAFSYYARSRHNDWSEDFIRGELAALNTSLYPGWINDLVVLCRSHHDGIAELRQSKFNAKYVGSPATPLNLRFLAVTLRVADVLEFAPERTPSVILKNRDIAPSSRIYWYKDHSISFQIEPVGKQLILSAQTPSAAIHKAVLLTAEWVNNELGLVAALRQENLLTSGIISPSQRESYRWPWPSQLITDIREVSGKFYYIDGSFRPDTQKLLRILSGTALYGNNLAALRELIQNSLDSIREQLAYNRISLDNPLDENAINSLALLHYVTISIIKNGDQILLTCEDNGTGMTRSIIERHMLVSGSGIRGESRRLERAAQDAGFAVERTGRFGIGVLSYFMLADSLTISTRRSQEAGDSDATGWRFNINGLDGFGELTKESRSSKGTTVILELKDEVVGEDFNHFFETVEEYIFSTFRWLPCKLTIRREFDTITQKTVGPGWTHDPNDNSGLLLDNLFQNKAAEQSLVTQRDAARIDAVSRITQQQFEAAKLSLRWTDVCETHLPNDGGVLRGSIPYFIIGGHCSALYISFEELDGGHRWRDDSIKRPRLNNHSSLHGIKIDNLVNVNDCMIDLDLRRSHDIKADRSKLIDMPNQAVEGAVEKFRVNLWLSFLKANGASDFNEVNVSYARLGNELSAALVRDNPSWLLRSYGADLAYCRPIIEPFMSIGRFSFYNWSSYHFRTNDAQIEAVPILKEVSNQILTFDRLFSGGRLIMTTGPENLMLGLAWDNVAEIIKRDGTIGSDTTKFPDSMSHVICAKMPNSIVFNQNHDFTKRASTYSSTRKCQPSAVELRDALHKGSESSRGATEFMLFAMGLNIKAWQWIQENHQDQLQSVFRLAGLDGSPAGVLDGNSYESARGIIRIDRAAFSTEDLFEPANIEAGRHSFVVEDRDGPR